MPDDKRKPKNDGAPDDEPDLPEGTRLGGGGEPIPADDPLDGSLEGEDARTIADHATPPTEGPAASGALPG